MIINGMLVPPPNIGDELEPGEPGYQAPTSADNGAITDYLSAEQRNILRAAGLLESYAKQQLALLDAAYRMSAVGFKLGRDLLELSAMKRLPAATLLTSMKEVESSSARMLVALQEIQSQFGGIPEHDVICRVLHSVNFLIANKKRALDWERKSNPAPDQERKGM